MGPVLTQKIILAVILLWFSTTAEAAWLIDNERFHVSVHGQLSCQDCHEGISERKRHPNPADVNKNLRDFFQLEQCTSCHDDVTDEISEGRHGGQEATLWQRFENCIECHDPHYQVRENDESAGSFSVGRQRKNAVYATNFKPSYRIFLTKIRHACSVIWLLTRMTRRPIRKLAPYVCIATAPMVNVKESRLESLPLIDPDQYASTPHMDVACLDCHPGAAEFGHGNQVTGDCRQCHFPHDEKVAHDAHAGVSCGVCHLKAVTPVRDSGSDNHWLAQTKICESNQSYSPDASSAKR